MPEDSSGFGLQRRNCRLDIRVSRRPWSRDVHHAIDDQRLHFEAVVQTEIARRKRSRAVVEGPRTRQLRNVGRRNLRKRREIRIVLIFRPLVDRGLLPALGNRGMAENQQAYYREKPTHETNFTSDPVLSMVAEMASARHRPALCPLPT